MKVRQQLISILLLVILSITIITYLLKWSISKETKGLLTNKLVESREIEVPKVLDLNASYMKSYVYDYSIWDQMVDFVEGRVGLDWADEELKEGLSKHKIDNIWVLDINGRNLYSSVSTDTFEINKLGLSNSNMRESLIALKNKSFFIKRGNIILEVFTSGISYTADKLRQQPAKGYLLLSRNVDSIYMANLKLLSGDLNFSLVTNEVESKALNNLKSGQIQFTKTLQDVNNNPIAAFNISRTYPLLNSYQKYLNNYLLLFLGIISFIGFLFYFFSERVLLKPLSIFSQSLKQNSADKLIPFLTKKNEYGGLAKQMTSFFAQNSNLENEVLIRKASEAKLQKALYEKDTAQVERIKIEEFLKQQQILLEVNARSSNLVFEDVLKRILVLSAKSIQCERIGIWEYNNDISAIKAEHIYLLSKNSFIKGEAALESDYPIYFKHLKSDTAIIANDAQHDKATAEFTQDYLIPLGITSMLDIPIRSGNTVIGVVCCEHIGPKREWGILEQMYIKSLSDIIAINYEKEKRRKAEVLLAKSHHRFEETQELAKIGSWEFNFITNEIVWSSEMYRIFDLVGVPDTKLFEAFRKCIHPQDQLNFDEAIKNLIENQKTYSVESRLINKTGEIKYILSIGEAILSPTQGKVVGIRGAVQDITKQKLASLAKSEFLSSMSHEIRTPINGVIGLSNLLMEEELTEKQKEYVTTLNFSAQHLSGLVSDILDFSKIESGFMTFEKVSFNLEKNCTYLFELFSTTAKEKNISYNFKPNMVKDFSLYGDFVRLNQIISNLLSNAIKFTNTGSVDFSYSVKEETNHNVTILFSIKDSGIGISKQQQHQIFESFKQANDTITRQYGGTGLGLTICKKLVELQGGKIEVVSEENEGAEFIVEMTFDKHVYPNEVLKALSTAEKINEKNLDGMRVLVAEDNKINAMVLTRYLAKWKIEYSVADDGIKALEMLNKENYDIVLMDIQMPNMDGIEATMKFKETENVLNKNIPIVAFTADASIDAHSKLLKIGFSHCLTKPFSPDVLFSYLQKSYLKQKINYV